MVDLNLKVPAVEKLLDYAASGIGAVAGPMLARRQAQAVADAARIEAQGQADVLRIKAQAQVDSMGLIASAQAEARTKFSVADTLIQGKVDIGNEIDLRLTFQEQKRQSNIGSVVGLAADELGDKEVQNYDIDHDWVARFFSDVQDVTSEHMQCIWAKILAGEVETPGRTSLHTLSILKNMSQQDAKLFEDASRFIFGYFILNDRSITNHISGFPVYEILLVLESYGLLHASDLEETIDVTPKGYVFYAKNIAYQISKEDNTSSQLIIPIFPLSPQGRELYSIVESTIDEDYLVAISQFLREKGNFNLKRAKIVQYPEDHDLVGPWITV